MAAPSGAASTAAAVVPTCAGTYRVVASNVEYSFTANTRGVYSVYLLPVGVDVNKTGVEGDQDSGTLPAPGSTAAGTVQARAQYDSVVVNINAAKPDVTCTLTRR